MNLELELFLDLLTEISRLPDETKQKIGRLVAKTEKRVSDLTLGEIALLSDIVQEKNHVLKNTIYRTPKDC